MNIKNTLSILILTFLSMTLSGCNWIILDPKGLVAVAEKNILILSVVLMLFVVIPVIVMAIAFAWHFREGNPNARYAPEWSHNTLLEVVWWTIPCIIIASLGFVTWVSSHNLDPFKPIETGESPIRIQVVALEWKWLFIYPDQHIASLNFVQFPVNKPVEFSITSTGPMNSFQIPQLAGQIYAMAGMESKLHLIANELGDYRGLSTNFSGEGFSDMKFTVHVSSEKEFDQWVQTVQKKSNSLTLKAYSELAKPSINKAPIYYKTPIQSLFDLVVMKALSPISMEELAKQCSPKLLETLKNKV